MQNLILGKIIWNGQFFDLDHMTNEEISKLYTQMQVRKKELMARIEQMIEEEEKVGENV